MNLPVFLKEVDRLSAVMSSDQMKDFIHEVARTLPEGKRDYFINALRTMGTSTEQAKNLVKDGKATEFVEGIETIKRKLAEINEGVLCLDSEYNEEWDDWYNSDEDEILFMDPQNILPIIHKAMELIHSCVDMEAYKEGCELAEILSVLEISVTGDYDDYNGSPLHIQELSSHRLLTRGYNCFVKECLYLTYMGNALHDRADELFCIMGNFECYDIDLEDILQTGKEELPQFHEFLVLWISYLGERRGKEAEKFLKEAQLMLQDEDDLLENARRFVELHPELYEQLLRLKQASGETNKMLQIGKEALDKITCSDTIRSEVALLTAEYACKSDDYIEAERCWLEAFRSNSSVMNYLRVRLLSRDWSQYAVDVRQIYEQVNQESKQNNGYNAISNRENRLHKSAYCVMLFFDEQFDRLYTVGMAEKKALGWSTTFMKEGLALFLLLIYKGNKLPKGLLAMLDRAVCACGIKTAEYYRGTGKYIEQKDSDLFWDLFNQWKDCVQISEDETTMWLNRIEKWISLRVTGIMENNRRNYYGECASYIAALGEVQESRGNLLAKSRIMENYRREYSRRSAFHQELRAYGMKS